MTTAPAAPAPAPTGLSRRRRALVWALVVVATLIGIASILTAWVSRQMLDNDSWERASRQVIQDPEVQSALSVYLVNELYDNVDVGGALGARLPPNLQALAGPAAAALRGPVTDGVEVLLASPRVEQLWVNANAAAHQRLVNVLRNETGFGISTGDGEVTVDLRELVAQLGIDLGLPAAAVDRLPEDAGVFTVMRSDQLSAAQQAVRAIDASSVWLLVLVLGLYALAVVLARGERRATLRTIGWAFILSGLVVLVTRRLGGSYAIDALAPPEHGDAGWDVWLIGTSILGEIGRAAILYGAVIVLGATLAGPTAAATAVRRRLAPVLNERPGVVWGAVGGAYLLLVLWGGTHALRTAWGIALLAALLAIGVEALRRRSLVEFPDAEAGDGLQALRARLGRGRRGDEPAHSTAEEVARLGALRDAGLLSADEFDRAKRLALS